MFNRFQQKVKELLEFATMNSAGVNTFTVGSLGSTSTPVPFPISGDGFSDNNYATMSIAGGTTPSKRKKPYFPKSKKIKLPNKVAGKFPLARRNLIRST
jgi:hypothetical protein